MRIYYQSFLEPEQHAPYFGRLEALLASVADPGTEFVVGGIDPPDSSLSPLSEFRCSVQVVDQIIGAAQRGFDAAIIGHFQDGGLYPARSAVDIPVLGLGESSMLYAAQLGRGFGLVTIDDVFLGWHREQADVYGVASRLVGVTSLAAPVADMVEAFDDDDAYRRVRGAFEECARPLAAAGAEVIFSAGGLFSVLTARESRLTVNGALVPNTVSLVAKLAEVAVKLDLRPSRKSTFALPSTQALAEFGALTGGRSG